MLIGRIILGTIYKPPGIFRGFGLIFLKIMLIIFIFECLHPIFC